ncbi:unnamed protein product [Porites evermanni]|uniref:Fibronectin type-II domain-containing protein n=1 Tax=Porites evermanni TaxID=104178 RepID=A0ABN8ST92_9CNID|nr:unnamed protein product [Porites evermanni]
MLSFFKRRQPVFRYLILLFISRFICLFVCFLAKGIGCFRDTGRRAVATMEGKSHLLTGHYRRRRDAIRKCALAAERRGYRVFAVQHGGWCAASRTAYRTYSKYGRSNRCRNGKGGPWANDVYFLKAKGVGCFRDTGRRAIATLEGKSRFLKGNYRRRSDAINKCAMAAWRRGYRVFAIQHGGWCAASRTAYRTYGKYGRSNKCRNGKGGPWANDVYFLKGSCRKRSTSGNCCVFPFVYKRRRYYRCVKGNGGRRWCANTPNYDRDRIWGYCAGGRARPIIVTLSLRVQRLGCFKDTGRRAVPQLDGKSRLLTGNYQRRKYAIRKCALAAARRGYKVFGVQHGGWCASGPRAQKSYAKYGRSNRCRNGKGGPWANDVYVVSGKCRYRTTQGYCCVPFRYRGRRYRGCARTRRGRTWCATTPDYPRNRLWGWCRGGSRATPIKISGVTIRSTGCFRDTHRRAVPQMDGRNPLVKDYYRRRKDAILKCALVAMRFGYRVFAVQHQGWCATGPRAHVTYRKYGRSNRCRNGKGGPWANDVYIVNGFCRRRTTTRYCCSFPFIYKGRRYNSCTRRRHNRPWCALTPNYDRDRKWGNCATRRPVRPPRPVVRPSRGRVIRISIGLKAYGIGCYKDTGRRAIAPLEGRSFLLTGSYRRRRYSVQKCALAAYKRGYKVFAVQHGGWCAASRYGYRTYGRYGRCNRCKNGKGGPWANDVYVLRGSCRVRSSTGHCCAFPFIYKGRRYNRCARRNHNRPWCALTPNYDLDKRWGNCPGRGRPIKITTTISLQKIGCFKDTYRRAIPQLDGRSPLLRGNYRLRRDAITKCVAEALKRGYRMIGIQHGGWCASGPRAQKTYAKYGRSNRCRNGKGGPWANDVYRISGNCKQRTTTGYCCFPFIYRRRRYNGCARTRRGRRWCAIAPNYNKNKLWGYCRGGNRPKPTRVTHGVLIKSLGCYRDTHRRAIPQMDGRNPLVKGYYRRRADAILKCALVALRFGYLVFAVQHQGWCATGPRAQVTYRKYGRSNRCRNGKGGPWANDVYKITGTCRKRTTSRYCCSFPFIYRGRLYNSCTRRRHNRPWCALTPNYDRDKKWGNCAKRRRPVRPVPPAMPHKGARVIRVTASLKAYNIGCYKDTSRRAIPSLEGRSRLLRGSYRRRKYAIRKCALAAQKRGFRVFAVQHQGWCASSRRAHLTYRRYGKSNRCRNGKGGPWANDVYVLRGSCSKRSTNGICCVFPFIYKGKRYNRCTRVNSRRPWCANTPNYNADKLYGFCGGRKVRPIKMTPSIRIQRIGCFRDTYRRAISQLDGQSVFLRGNYQRRRYAIQKCAYASLKRGYAVFGVQNGGWCASGSRAYRTFAKYGRSNRCRNGKGGPWANDVYRISANSLGCYRDTARRAIPQMDGRNSLVKGYYRRRADAILKCALVALRFGYRVFALQHQGWCATGPRVHVTYKKYGRSNRCRNGKGGPWANDVYKIAGICRRRTTTRYCCAFPFVYKGRRYNSCTRRRHSRPWCALTPNYDRDKKWGNCARRRKPVRPNPPIVRPPRARVIKVTTGLLAYSIGCYKDTSRRAISPLEGRSRLLKGYYRRRRDAIKKCALAAEKRGYKVFAMQHQGWCASSRRAHLTYRRYGKSNRCRNGKGGPWANTVYVLRGSCRTRTSRRNCCAFPFTYRGKRYNSCTRVRSKRPWCSLTSSYDKDKLYGYCGGRKAPIIRVVPSITVQRIGCFKDTFRRAIPQLDGKSRLLRGNYQRRTYAIQKCVLETVKRGFSVIGVQNGGWCASGPRAHRTFGKYGRSNRCRSGKGGPWANDVYRISGTCRHRTISGECCVPFIYRRRRYNGCARHRSGRKWCYVTPDYRRNRLWGWCRGGTRSPPIKVTTGVRIKRIGCFKDTSRRAIPGVDGRGPLLTGYYRRRREAIKKCALYAVMYGFRAFAVQHQGWCATGPKAHVTYRKYGKSNRCRNGKGGPWANDVYMISGTCRKRTAKRYCCSFPFIYKGRRYNKCTRRRHNRPWCALTSNYDRDRKWDNCAGRRPVKPVKPVVHPKGRTVRITIGVVAKGIGCYRDTSRRAISTLEGKSRLLIGNYRRRLYAIQKCASAALKRGFRIFALQHGGWCASSKRAHLTYGRYGRSNRCRNGKGGPWANNVYVLRGSCRARSSTGNCCMFPFVYRGRRYNRCIRVKSKRPWCSLTPSYDRDKIYGYCGGQKREI